MNHVNKDLDKLTFQYAEVDAATMPLNMEESAPADLVADMEMDPEMVDLIGDYDPFF